MVPGSISPRDAAGLVVIAWRSSEEGLYLRFRGQTAELRLQSGCGRCHWLVHEHVAPGGAQLLVTCHACREHYAFSLERAAA